MTPLLSCHAVEVAVHECVLVQTLSLTLHAGQITAVLGRNGVGKSLTLQTLAGLRVSEHGAVLLNGQPMSQLSRRQIAQQLGFVAQDHEEVFPVTALQCAVAGRHPHLDFWSWESAHDFALAQAALQAVDLHPFSERPVATLSGGERRRLAIATALTQAPRVFVLDEPTNHLDPQHQLQVLKLMRERAEAGCAVIMSLHDPNLATRFADQVLLLSGAGPWQHGPATELLTTEHLSNLYQTPTELIGTAGASHFRFV